MRIDSKDWSRGGKIVLRIVLVVMVAAGLGSSTWTWMSGDNNLKQVDGPAPNGQAAYRLYRSAAPSKKTFASWCQVYNIKRVIVLSGDAGSHEKLYQAQGVCPDIELVYDKLLNFSQPMDRSFLEFFDKEVARAKQDQVGLIFRCLAGSHRTGTLAAYYQMKYLNMDYNAVVKDLNNSGMLMSLFDPVEIPQVQGLDAYVHNRPCSAPAACVKDK